MAIFETGETTSFAEYDKAQKDRLKRRDLAPGMFCKFMCVAGVNVVVAKPSLIREVNKHEVQGSNGIRQAVGMYVVWHELINASSSSLSRTPATSIFLDGYYQKEIPEEKQLFVNGIGDSRALIRSGFLVADNDAFDIEELVQGPGRGEVEQGLDALQAFANNAGGQPGELS